MAQEVAENAPGVARLRVAGVGGAGGNAIRGMRRAQVRGVEFLAINTDAQALSLTDAHMCLRIGERLTRGLGAGGNPDVGLRAAEESHEAIRAALAGADMLFLTAGMGGGTGTGASPAVAMIARELGVLTVAIVSTPFTFEGEPRRLAAERGLTALREQVDTLIVVPNERLLRLGGHSLRMSEAYALADDVLRQGIQAISDLIAVPGHINLDFADVRAVMAEAGSSLMSVGIAGGEDRGLAALRAALTNPLLDVDITGARSVLVNITAGADLTIQEAGVIVTSLREMVHPEANILFGTVEDQGYEGQIKVTLVATGFEPGVSHAAANSEPPPVWHIAREASTHSVQDLSAFGERLGPLPDRLARRGRGPAAYNTPDDTAAAGAAIAWHGPRTERWEAGIVSAGSDRRPAEHDPDGPRVGPAHISPAGHAAESSLQRPDAESLRRDRAAILRGRR
jgi:cell division protein FtsZ